MPAFPDCPDGICEDLWMAACLASVGKTVIYEKTDNDNGTYTIKIGVPHTFGEEPESGPVPGKYASAIVSTFNMFDVNDAMKNLSSGEKIRFNGANFDTSQMTAYHIEEVPDLVLNYQVRIYTTLSHILKTTNEATKKIISGFR